MREIRDVIRELFYFIDILHSIQYVCIQVQTNY